MRADGKSQLETGSNGIAAHVLKALRRNFPAPDAFFWRYVGGPRQVSLPDIHGCVYGLFVALEIKQPGKQPSMRQADSMNILRDARGITAVITCEDDLAPITAYIREFVYVHKLAETYPPFGPPQNMP